MTIYSINLETHDPLVKAAIGGPHSSFSALVNYNGGLSRVRQTLQNLYIQLNNFKKHVPPDIPIFPISAKEQAYRRYNFQKEFDICGNVDLLENYEVLEEMNVNNCQTPSSEVFSLGHTCCSSCFVNDKVRDMKYWYRQMEAGSTVDYR